MYYKFVPNPPTYCQRLLSPSLPPPTPSPIGMTDIVIRRVGVYPTLMLHPLRAKAHPGRLPHVSRRSPLKCTYSRDPSPSSSGYSRWGVVQQRSSSPPVTSGFSPPHPSATRPRKMSINSEKSSTLWLRTPITTTS